MDENVKEIVLKSRNEGKLFFRWSKIIEDAQSGKIIWLVPENIFVMNENKYRSLKRRIKELEESLSYWKRAWDLECVHAQQCEKRIEELEEGIRKHKQDKQNMIEQAHVGDSGSYLDSWDEELYKLLEKKNAT